MAGIGQDNLDLLCEWVTRFSVETVVHSIVEPTEMQKTIPYSLTATPQALYLGEPLPCSLPSNTLIRPLTYADSGAIEKWAGGKRDGYVLHLLNEQHYNDPATVEYGVVTAVGKGVVMIHAEYAGVRYTCIIRSVD